MTWTSRLAARIPDKILVRAISLVYARAEPELGKLDDICGRGGVMVDVGAWYGPWSQRLARRADHLVAIEPTSRHQVLRKTLPANAEVIQAAASDHAGTGEPLDGRSRRRRGGALLDAQARHPWRMHHRAVDPD